MTDTTQGDQLPDVEGLFPEKPLPDVDSLFPESVENERYRRQQLGTSPVQDFLMSNEGPVGTVFHSAGRVLKAFGQGVNDVGAATGLSKEMSDYLKKWSGYDNWTEGHQKIAKAAKNVLLDPIAYDWAVVSHGLSGVLAGSQAAVVQAGKEVGQEKLAREIAAIPEAYPTFEFRGGMPSPQMAEIARARALDVIGPGGEAAWKGVAAPAESPAPAKAGEAATPSGVEPSAAETPAEPVAPPPWPVAEPAPPPAEKPADIHAAARQIDPETFRQYDALAARKETFRRWIDELRETRNEQVAAEAPHAEEIADLQRRIADPDTTNRLRKKYEARLEPLVKENQAYVAERAAGDSADMTKVRQRLQETDYAMRDLAPKVTAAYRRAQERFPDLVPKEEVPAPTEVASTAAPVEPAAAEVIAPVPAAAAEPAPRAAPEKPAETPAAAATPGATQPEITPPAPAAEAAPAAQAPATPTRTIDASTSAQQQRDFIRNDVARQLMRAGRPKEEAEAAGALIAARYETRAARFKGARGTAEDLYREEGAEILGPGMRSAQGPLPPPLTAPRKVNEEKLSLLQFLAHQGGLRRTADLEAILDKNPFVPGFGRLFREGGMNEEHALEAAVAAEYIGTEEGIRGTGNINDFRAAIADEARGRKRYRIGYEPEAKLDEGEQEYLRESAERELMQSLPGIHIHGIPQGREFYQVTAFHGSPHDFDRFDLSKIGTGEGVQAYGYGLYFAENENVAKEYKRDVTARGLGTEENYAFHAMQRNNGDRDAAIQDLKRGAQSYYDRMANRSTAGGWKIMGDELSRSAEMLEKGYEPPKGKMYKVSINADPEHFLDWDKPLSDQSPKVKEALQKAGMFTHPDIGRLEESIPRAKARLSDIEKTLSSRERTVAQRNIADDEHRLAQLKEAQAKGTLNLTVDNLLSHSERGDEAEISKKLRQAGVAGIKYLDQGSRFQPEMEKSQTSNYVIFDDKLIDITHKDGEPVSKAEADQVKQNLLSEQKEFAQSARGKINILEGRRPIITLMREANASTFIHETGHDFLEQMARDASHEAAPDALKADMATTLDWLHVKEGDKITTRAHEKFARGFEQYLREGTAPSPGLANVFAQFRDWLTKIYQTIKGLGVPINDDIRDVFDRMLAEHPQRTMIVPEREVPKSLGEQRLAEAGIVAPENTAAHAEGSEQEIRSIAAQNLLPEEQNELLGSKNRASSPANSASSAEHPEAPGGGAESQAPPGEGGGPTGTRAIVEGSSEGAPEGARPRAGKTGPSVKTEPPAGPNAPFEGPKSPLVDKAGNIRLDKLDTAEDVTQVIRETAAANDEFISERRGVLSDHETLALADALGMSPEYLERKKIGEAFSVEEIRAARRLLVQSATAVRDAMIAAKDGSTEAIVKLAEVMSTHEMIQSKVAQATSEAGRSLRAFRETIPGYENVSLLDTFLKQQTGRTLFQLQEIARLGSNLRTPQQVGRFVHDTAYGKIKQAIIYYYVNALISGPFTHLRYAVGNALTALWTPLVKIPAAAVFGTVRNIVGFERDAERVYLGEAGAQLYGIMKGSREGLRAALEGWRTGNTPHLPGEAAPNMFEAQPVMPPIPGTLGYMLGLPGKGVGAIHGFFSALRYEQEIHGMAYREAMKQNLSGEAFTSEVTALADRPSEDMMQTAAAQARKDLYMAPADYQSFEAKLARIANHNIGTKILLPFVKIGTQIVRTAIIESTPLGLFEKKVKANLRGENGNAAREMQAGQIIAGTALMGVMSGMVLEGLATGDGPSDPAKRAVWLLNHHPNSIQVGDLTLTYERLGALGMLMRTAANAAETARGWGDDQGHTIAMDFLYGTERAILGESFLTGIKDMIDAVYHFDQYSQRYMAQMITNWIPFSIGFSQTARKIDPYQREVRASSLLDAIWKEAEAKVPWLSESLMPRRDMFGEPIPSSGPQQNYENDRVVARMNELHIGVGRLAHKLRGVDLTDQQFDDYARVAGRTAKMLLNNLIQPGFERLPQGMQVELIHNAITQGRKVGADSVIMKAMGSTNDIMKKSVDAKQEKITGKPVTLH